MFAYIKTGWQLGSSHFLPMHYFQEDIVSSGFIEYDNTRTTYFSEIGGSRYFPSVMTSFAMDFQYNHSRKVVFVQKQVLPFRSGRYVVHMRSETRLAPKLRLELDGTLQHSRYFTGASTGQSSNISNGIREFDIKGSLRYKASSRLFFSLIDRLIGESQYKQSIYNFLDLRARYQHSKWKMDFELALNNLGNLTEYRSVLVSDNRVSVSNYTLRGRNIRLFLRFNL